jgi:hypothetical protein
MTVAPVAGTRVAPRSLFRELLAVLLLTVGSILPVLPWLVGVALLWTSDRWRVGEKLLATLVWPLGYAGVLVATGFVATGTTTCVSSASAADAPAAPEHCSTTGMPETLGIVLLVVLVVAPLVVNGVLLVRAARRRRAGSPR